MDRGRARVPATPFACSRTADRPVPSARSGGSVGPRGLFCVGDNGFLHLSVGNRAKSASVECGSQPCSMANAARCASVTRLAVAWPSVSIRWNTAQCRSVGWMILTHGCSSQLRTRASDCSSERGRSNARGFGPDADERRHTVQHRQTESVPDNRWSHQMRASRWRGLDASSAYKRMLASTRITGSPRPRPAPGVPECCRVGDPAEGPSETASSL